MFGSKMHLKSKAVVIKTLYMSTLKHFAFDQKNSIFLQVPIDVISIMETYIITSKNLFINYGLINYVKTT